MAVGLNYWQIMRLIILPQALKITIPNIVNNTIGLFKDTTLVFIVGIFDFLRTIEAARIDPKWATPVTAPRATPSRRSSISSAATACRAMPAASRSGSPRRPEVTRSGSPAARTLPSPRRSRPASPSR